MKRCSTCNLIKLLSEFYKNSTKKDGYLYSCKICHLKYMKEYGQTKKGKKVISKAIKRYRQTKKGKINKRIWEKRYHINHPAYHRATAAVSYAIKTGKLPRPNTLQCSYGNHQAQQYHHHKGYTPEHRLDVLPVCQRCHKKIA